jgi:predicted DNA-binding transcriptional regulator AlpA
LSRSTIWRLERQGAFPRHRRISRNAVAWVEDEVADWMRSKMTNAASAADEAAR